VQVPNVIGKPIELAKARLAVQPLKSRILYKPLTARQRPGVVLQQYPRSGTLSSYDAVTLFLGKPLHGVVPYVTGLRLEQARSKLEDAKLLPRVVKQVPQPKRLGRVLFQAPRGGVAASPGMEIRLIVAGSPD
jgi:hypothetical protein